MEKFRTKKVSVKLECACLETFFFREKFGEYYEFLGSSICESKVHGYYLKEFFKLKSIIRCNVENLDLANYDELPRFVCTSILN